MNFVRKRAYSLNLLNISENVIEKLVALSIVVALFKCFKLILPVSFKFLIHCQLMQSLFVGPLDAMAGITLKSYITLFYSGPLKKVVR